MRSSRRVAVLKALGTLSVFLICYSWILRPAFLFWGAGPVERGRSWPGREIVRSSRDGAEPEAGSVRAVTIAAPPARVWPWLAQIGQTRGGFYSYTWLENLLGCGMVNAASIHPEWQSIQPGDRIYLAPPHRYGGRAFLVAAHVDPPRALVLVSPQDWLALRDGARARGFIWSFELRDAPGGGTTLIARSAGERTWASLAFWEPAHFVMERAMLLGIRRRAEPRPPATAGKAAGSTRRQP